MQNDHTTHTDDYYYYATDMLLVFFFLVFFSFCIMGSYYYERTWQGDARLYRDGIPAAKAIPVGVP